jgi:N-acetylneuraminic acid mutarotase
MTRTALLAVLVIGFASTALAESVGQWTTGAPMLSARTEVAVAAVDGKVYVAGGFGGGTALEIYHPQEDRWSRGAPVPQSVHHAAAVGTGGKLYLVGGFADGWNPVDSVYEYDPKLDRWQARASLPTARGALAAVTVDGKIHALGGMAPGRQNTAAHEVYDPGDDSWTERGTVADPERPSHCGRRGRSDLRDRRPDRGELRAQSCGERGVRAGHG